MSRSASRSSRSKCAKGSVRVSAGKGPKGRSHKSYCKKVSSPKTQEKCASRKMKWVKGSATRLGYCRKSAKPKKMGMEDCKNKGMAWVTSKDGKRKSYCRKTRTKKTKSRSRSKKSKSRSRSKSPSRK